MIYKMELSDSTDTMVFELLEVPIDDKDVTGVASNTTIDGNVFNDYLWLKKQYVQKWSIMCQDEYEQLRGFWTRQFGNAEVPFYRLFYGDNVYEDKNFLTSDGFTQILNQTERTAPLLEYSLYGNATQETTAGKNLLGIPDGTYTNNGITATAVNGEVKLTGTATANSFLSITLAKNIVLSQAWSFSLNNTVYGDSATEVRLVDSDGQFINVGTTTADNKRQNITTYATYLRLMFRTSSGVNPNGATLRPQVELGSTATSYEPYTGGSPMPNPQFPSDVNVVSGAQTVKITGKNLVEDTISDSSIDANGIIRSNSDFDTQVAFVVEGKTYTLSYTGGTVVGGYFATKPTINSVSIDGTRIVNNNKTFVAQYTGYFTFRTDAGESNAQCELGSTATTYEPYHGQSQEINLGKNLLGLQDTATTEQNYVTISVQDGIISLNGTASVSFGVIVANLTEDLRLTNGIDYAISMETISGSVSRNFDVQLRDESDANIFSINSDYFPVSRNTLSGVGKKLRLYFAYGTTFTNYKIAFQIERGTQATAYAPFMHTSRNLLNASTATANYRLTTAGALYAENGFTTSDFIEVEPNTTYTVSVGTVPSPYFGSICQYDSSKAMVGSRADINRPTTTLTFTTNSSAKYVRISEASSVFGVSLQLELGSQATFYEPYGAQYELAKLGDYQDYIWNDDGTWKIHKEVGKVVLDGTEAWYLFGNNSGFFLATADALAPTSPTTTDTKLVISDNYSACLFNDIYTSAVDYGVSLYGATNPINRICFRNKDCATANDFKTWLTSHNTTVYYALATPTDTEITDSELVGQLNHAYGLYVGQNNLSLIPSGGAQGEMAGVYRLIYEEETNIIPSTPVVLTLSDGGIINPCGCRQNIQLIMRETKEQE